MQHGSTAIYTHWVCRLLVTTQHKAKATIARLGWRRYKFTAYAGTLRAGPWQSTDPYSLFQGDERRRSRTPHATLTRADQPYSQRPCGSPGWFGDRVGGSVGLSCPGGLPHSARRAASTVRALALVAIIAATGHAAPEARDDCSAVSARVVAHLRTAIVRCSESSTPLSGQKCRQKQRLKLKPALARARQRTGCPATIDDAVLATPLNALHNQLAPRSEACNCCRFGHLALTGLSDDPSYRCGVVRDEHGADLLPLACGNLAFGGGAAGLPQPVPLPTFGRSMIAVAKCDAGSATLHLVATTASDTGSNRTCTSALVANPEYPLRNGCLFGPPLPIANALAPRTSVCVVSRLASDLSGALRCESGELDVQIALNFDVYVTGDLLDGSAPNRPLVDGLQPCPVCAEGRCKGGPRHDLPCVVDTPSASRSAYTTSHDCPPPGSSADDWPFAGTFAGLPSRVTTGRVVRTSDDTGDQLSTFCGFCARPLVPIFRGSPPIPCTSDADCVESPFTKCRQHSPGAFGHARATTIISTGAAAGKCMAGGDPHEMRLATVFCIPPTFGRDLDSSADLPSPGLLGISVRAQLLP